MSAGNFVRSFYQLNNGQIARIRVQPETISGFNVPAAGPATVPGSARVSGGNRRIGIKARSITLRWVGAPPTGYAVEDVIRIPILQESVWDGLNDGDTVSYLGANAEVVGRQPERVR